MKIKAFWKRHWLKLVLGLIVFCTALGAAFIGTAGTERQAASAAAYTAKGSFTFATRIASTPFECSVNFTSNNVSFNKIEVRLENSDYQIIYTHTSSSSSSDMSLVVYNDGWTSDAYRTIDFGDAAVDITERLYLLLDSGASEGEDGELSNVSSYVVEGSWRFNSTPSLSGGSRSQTLTNTYIISTDFLREAITKITVSSSGRRTLRMLIGSSGAKSLTKVFFPFVSTSPSSMRRRSAVRRGVRLIERLSESFSSISCSLGINS